MKTSWGTFLLLLWKNLCTVAYCYWLAPLLLLVGGGLAESLSVGMHPAWDVKPQEKGGKPLSLVVTLFVCLIKSGIAVHLLYYNFSVMMYLRLLSVLVLIAICYFLNSCMVFQSVHYHDRFNQPSINGCIGCTNIFAIISNAERNILVCMSLCTCGIYSEM